MPAPASRRAQEVIKHLGGNVQRLRQKRGLTQERLAEMTSLDLSYTQRVERGQINVTLGTLVTFADALEVPPAALLRPGKGPVITRGRPTTKRRRRT
ncbi:MAG: helix-turn-helix domain-containing protein [Myxococcota bacterium]